MAQAQRFSDTIAEPEMQNLVRRIFARNGDSFATSVYFYMDDDENRVHWREARLVPGTKYWRVYQYAGVPDIYPDRDGNLPPSGEQAAEKCTIVMDRACFFDALHACALFERFETDRGNLKSGRHSVKLNMTHYIDFARAEGIDFSKDTGMPVPVAEGLPLTNAILSPEARDVMKRAKGNLLPEQEGLNTVFANPDNLPVPASLPENLEAYAASVDRQKEILGLKTRMETAATALETASSALAFSVNNKFRTITDQAKYALKRTAKYTGANTASWVAFAVLLPYGGVAAIPFLTGIFSGLAILITTFDSYVFWGNGNSLTEDWKNKNIGLPRRRFAKHIKALDRRIETLPEGELRDALKQTAREAELAFHSLWLRQAFRDAVENKSGYKRAQRAFTKVCHAQGLEESVIAGMINRLSQNLDSRELEEKITKSLNEKMSFLGQDLTVRADNLKSLPVP